MDGWILWAPLPSAMTATHHATLQCQQQQTMWANVASYGNNSNNPNLNVHQQQQQNQLPHQQHQQ